MDPTETIQNYFKSLTIIHAALLLGQVFFGIVACYLVLTGLPGNNMGDLHDIFQNYIPLGVIGSILGSLLITKSRLKTAREKNELEEKLGHYRATLIIKFALLEGATFLALICFVVTANYFLLGLAALTIIIFSINRPTKDKATTDLELNYAERAAVNSNR